MAPTPMQKSDRDIAFGLIFFSSSEAPFSGEKYRLVIESARFADAHGFSSVWIPERHFTKDGWLYPNPAVLQAALARETRQIQLRAGSVVIPLHNPIRVAEEWAMVDNLSGGRVGISFASGWHPNDFVLFPENYNNRQEAMYRGIQTVQKLWRGESIQAVGGDGNTVEIRTYPPPIQPELPIWITAAGNPKTFAGAGEIGANLLTHMYNQSIEELAEKIRLYREARAKHGYDPESGQVSVMLHTFIGENTDAVYEQARPSFCEYLRSASYLLNAIAYSRGQKVDLASLSEQDVNDYLNFVFERLVSTQRVLFGTPESCLDMVAQLRAAGVNEIACQMDFGVDIDTVLQSLPYLDQLKQRSNTQVAEQPPLLATTVETTTQVESTAPEHIANGHNASQIPSAPLSPGDAQTSNTLQDIQSRCKEEVSLPDFYDKLSKHGIQLAISFRGIERLWRRDGEAVGQVQLHASLAHDTAAYQIHPTFLDACFQVLIAALPQEINASGEEVLYLPTGLRSFRMYRQPGRQVWSHAVLKTNTTSLQDGDAITAEGDVYVVDEAGQILIEAIGLQLQRSAPISTPQPEQQEQLADYFYEPRWELQPLEQKQSSSIRQPGRWLIFMDSSGVGQHLAQRLTAQGNTCVKVSASYSYQALEPGNYRLNPSNPDHMQHFIQDVLASGASTYRGIIHLWSLDMTPLAETSIASLEADQALGVGSALNLIQALANMQSSEPPRIWFVTKGTQPVGSANAPLAVAQSPLWGLGKTCAIEHPELWGGLIDADPQEKAEGTAAQLLLAITTQSDEDQIAFRQGQRYVARLVRNRDVTRRALKFLSDSSYLITGGLWGLGFEVARWMAQQNVRHLVLTGRTALPPRSDWDKVPADSRLARQISGIRELEGLGVRVQYAAVDVADEKQMTALVQSLPRQGYPPIKGVVHTASVWQDQQRQSLVRPLTNLNGDSLKTVFHPKVLGSWLLYKLFQQTPLDFFVSFSSGASLFGSAAQGNYAAAGAFLDVLAHHMRATGQPALSIDWGAVSETGFGATAEGLHVHEYWESHGIQRVTPQQVLAALAVLIPQEKAQVGVLKLDWHQLQQFYPQLEQLPFVSYLNAEVASESRYAETIQQPTSAALQTLLDAPLSERQQLMVSYLSTQVAGVLRIPSAKLDIHQPLTALGLDSLMAIELKNRIEHELEVRLSIVAFLQGPSIVQFADQILDQLPETLPMQATTNGNLNSQAGSVSVKQDHPEQLLARLDQLSDDEVDSLLNTMIEQEHSQTQGDGIIQQDAEQLLAQIDQLTDNEVDSLLSHIVQEEGATDERWNQKNR